MPQQTIESVPVMAAEPYSPPRRVTMRISQGELRLFWEMKRLVDGFEHRLRTAVSVHVESGELSLPALRAKEVV